MTDTKRAPLAVATRPNGNTYRARVAPSIENYESSNGAGVIVMRCASDEVARAVAMHAIDALDLNPFEARFRWLRLVPFDPTREYDASFQRDEIRGVPCIEFGEWR